MGKARRSLARTAALLALALVLQGSTCRVRYSSGDDDEDDERTETLVLAPRLDPWGRPLGGPILLPIEVLRPAE